MQRGEAGQTDEWFESQTEARKRGGVKAASQALVGRSPAEDGGLKAEVKDAEDESPRLLLTPTRSQGQTHR